MSATTPAVRPRCSGQALIAVLLIVLILTAVAVSVTWSAKRYARDGADALRDTQAYFALSGAINYASVELQIVTNNGATMPDLSSPPPNTDSNGWTQIGDAWYHADFVDTASRANINLASGSQLALLPALYQDFATVASILTWRSSTGQPVTVNGATGADSSYYESLNPPYDTKNAPFDTISELLLIQGMTPERLYEPVASGITGPSSDMSSQSPIDTSGTASNLPLSEMLTTYSRELNVASDGTPRVDVTSANASTIASGLGISSSLAQRLVQYRQRTPITSIAGIMRIPGFSRTIMEQIADRVSVGRAQYRTGVYNINTAPPEVLATIPGIDQATYDTVVQARQDGTVFSGLGDLFSLPSLSTGQLMRLVDNVCTKSSVYLVRVRVRIPGSPRVYAAEAEVEVLPDTSTSGTSGSSSSSTMDQGLTGGEETIPEATIVWWHEVPKHFGWETWAPPVTQSQITPQ